MRIKGVAASAKHKKILKLAKGMQHDRTRSYRLAKQAVIKALSYSYRDRRNKKRDLRALWLLVLMLQLELGTTYGKMIAGLKSSNIQLDRKTLSNFAVDEPKAFAKIVEEIK